MVEWPEHLTGTDLRELSPEVARLLFLEAGQGDDVGGKTDW